MRVYLLGMAVGGAAGYLGGQVGGFHHRDAGATWASAGLGKTRGASTRELLLVASPARKRNVVSGTKENSIMLQRI